MARDIKSILKLRVPVIVRIGAKRMPLEDVLALSPGAIIELPKPAERPLDLMVNNKVIGLGDAVKIGENFGLRVLKIGDASARVQALVGEAREKVAARKAAESTEASPDGEAPPADSAKVDKPAPQTAGSISKS
ncbi:MAG: FliM/FliN family flagellar motor switch protein [Phycisphaeraceae bacterium]